MRETLRIADTPGAAAILGRIGVFGARCRRPRFEVAGGAQVGVDAFPLGTVTLLQHPDQLAALRSDPGVFPEPERLDIHRGNRHHVGFGYGVHQCIGQNLARLELEIAFSALFERIPNLRVAVPVDELSYKHGGVLFGLHELPVTW